MRCDLAAKIEFWFQSISAGVGPVFAIGLNGFMSNVSDIHVPEDAGQAAPSRPAQARLSYLRSKQSSISPALPLQEQQLDNA
jgi:hypothetical protein